MKTRVLLTSCAALLASLTTEVSAQLVLSPGLQFASEGGPIGAGNFGTTGTPFALDLIGGTGVGPHVIPNLNNGTFGNDSSWIGNSANSYAGIGFGSAQSIASFAFGRDNLGAFLDRAAGLYTVQYTTGANPAINHATSLWNTIGTISLNADPVVGVTSPALRHRFNIAAPVSATGFRLIAPNGAAIDEIELFSAAGPVTPPLPALGITPAPGFSVTWNGNDGVNFSAGGLVPNNLALAANAAVPFASGALGPQLGITYHQKSNLNDGRYGNANSWIGGDGDAVPFHAGVMLEDVYDITSIAWGRDNGIDTAGGDPGPGGQLSDRSGGTYVIQRTLDGNVWETVGTMKYNYNEDTALGGGFTSYFRHEYQLSDGNGGIQAMGMRILVPGSGIGGQGTAIDEIELYGTPVPEPGSAALILGGLACIAGRRRRRE